ncbi:MAG: hypothetical protein AAF490_04980 [Chloroflexota bacterium]
MDSDYSNQNPSLFKGILIGIPLFLILNISNDIYAIALPRLNNDPFNPGPQLDVAFFVMNCGLPLLLLVMMESQFRLNMKVLGGQLFHLWHLVGYAIGAVLAWAVIEVFMFLVNAARAVPPSTAAQIGLQNLIISLIFFFLYIIFIRRYPYVW